MPTRPMGPSTPIVVSGATIAWQPMVTTGDLTLYVDPLGNDSNAGTASGASACLTIQGAINKIPKIVKHRVLINVAAGNYAAFNLSGITFDTTGQSAGYIEFLGVMVNATLAAGSATGTATSGTAGTASTATFGTLTDTSQTWTVNALKGLMVEILTGTGNGVTNMRPIISNTADTITIAGTWTAPVAGSTYAIRDWGSVINSTITMPASVSTLTTAATGIQLGSMPFAYEALVLNKLKVDINVSTLMTARAGQITILNSNFTSAHASGAVIAANGGATIGFSRSVLSGSTTFAPFFFLSRSTIGSVTNCYIFGRTGSATVFGVGGPGTITVSSCAFENLSTGIFLGAGGVAAVNGAQVPSGATVTTLASGTAHTYFGNGYSFTLGSGGIKLSGTTTTGIVLSDKADLTITTTPGVVGTGATTVISMTNGAFARWNSNATATGGTTDISLDGTAYTFAALRAVVGPPAKRIAGTSGSVIYEP
jgi:hypothetical protein